MKPMPADMRYAPEVFEKDSLAAARDIILRPQPGVPTDTRWERETEWMMERVAFSQPPGVIFDIGCGIGRLSKPLVERGHYVIGVDGSASMRQMAQGYVDQPARFECITPEQFNHAVSRGLRGKGAITAWVFQHIPDMPLTRLVRTLWSALEKGASFYALERPERWIPVKWSDRNTWFDDQLNVVALLRSEGFTTDGDVQEPPTSICRAGAELRRWIK